MSMSSTKLPTDKKEEVVEEKRFKFLSKEELAEKLIQRIQKVKKEHEAETLKKSFTKYVDDQDRETDLLVLEGILSDIIEEEKKVAAEKAEGEVKEKAEQQQEENRVTYENATEAQRLITAMEFYVADKIEKFYKEESLRRFIYKMNDPNNSSLFKGMRADAGESADNKLDAKTKAALRRDLRDYVLLNANLDANQDFHYENENREANAKLSEENRKRFNSERVQHNKKTLEELDAKLNAMAHKRDQKTVEIAVTEEELKKNPEAKPTQVTVGPEVDLGFDQRLGMRREVLNKTRAELNKKNTDVYGMVETESLYAKTYLAEYENLAFNNDQKWKKTVTTEMKDGEEKKKTQWVSEGSAERASTNPFPTSMDDEEKYLVNDTAKLEHPNKHEIGDSLPELKKATSFLHTMDNKKKYELVQKLNQLIHPEVKSIHDEKVYLHKAKKHEPKDSLTEGSQYLSTVNSVKKEFVAQTDKNAVEDTNFRRDNMNHVNVKEPSLKAFSIYGSPTQGRKVEEKNLIDLENNFQPASPGRRQ